MKRQRLHGPIVKLLRAQHHLNTLNAAMREFLKSDLHQPGSGGVFDFAKEWQELLWQNVQPTPPEWGAILGDIAHNVRSGLDHLVWQMVKACDGEPGKHTQFPIADSEKKWADDITARDIPKRGLPPTAGLSNEALDLVKKFQPFQRGDDGRIGKSLRTLHLISNTDKHRLLHGSNAFVSQKPKNLRIEPRGYLAIEKVRYERLGRILENGARLASVKLRVIQQPPPGVKVEVLVDVGAHVAFFAGDSAIKFNELAPILRGAKTVIDTAATLTLDPG